ncbi:DUF7577 domain-containing protein [Zongyangia hominis]|uniref:DUF7577 domain-containing protein n=1 Tax=Zongyangia hominis TaxID=2763677 RepID=A0A926IBP8_9FIRM|nr:hypothetical protein [Zongyangia hominis]MBC8570407.1 hypothetical protein [Zongyangia hominis]
MKCPQCGTEVEEQYHFCPQCQAKLHVDAGTSDWADTPAAPSQAQDSMTVSQEPSNSSGDSTASGSGPQTPGGPYAGAYQQNYQQNAASGRYGPVSGTAYDYYTQKNRAANQAARQPGYSASNGQQPGAPHPTVNYQPPKKHTGLIVAIVIVAVIVVVSLFTGLFAIIRWAEYHYEDSYYQYQYGWDDDYWEATSVQHTIPLPGGHCVTIPKDI